VLALVVAVLGPAVTAIPGASSVEQLESNVAAADIDLSDEEMAQLNAAVPRDAVRGQRHWDMAAVNR
jgi:aryl-alcohol dehydrogenase-like predicted oxidoreductase